MYIFSGILCINVFNFSFNSKMSNTYKLFGLRSLLIDDIKCGVSLKR